MEDILKNQRALITGAAQGIGRRIALTFANAGADLVLFDLDLNGLESLSKEVRELGREIDTFIVDVSSLEEVEKAMKTVLDKHGKIDILVNNAGITRDNLLLRMNEEEWDKVLMVNLKGVFNCCKALAKSMLKERKGTIINIASIIALIGNAGQVNYAASKAGIIGLTKSLAKEFAPRGIRVNAIAPGYIKTKMTEALPSEIKEKMLNRIPLARMGEPQDVANVALFLASNLSSYITGQVIIVDGGMILG